MMSAAAEEDQVSTAPPVVEESFQPPAIVDGITDEEGTQRPPGQPAANNSSTTPATNSPRISRDSMFGLLNSLSATVTQAVRVSTTEVTKAVESVVPSVQKSPLPVLLLFGDSITELASSATDPVCSPGWAAILSERYNTKLDVLNRGVSGYNSRWALHIFPRIVHGLASLQSLRAITIGLGANDAADESTSQHVPLKEYRYNLHALTHFILCLRRMTPVIPILITPPPVVTAQLMEDISEDPPRCTPERTASYAKMCVQVAEAMKCPVVDTHSAMIARAAELDSEGDVQKGLQTFFYDGLHLNAEGNKFVAECIFDTFRKRVPDLLPESFDPPFPHWTEVDTANPTLSLGTSSLL